MAAPRQTISRSNAQPPFYIGMDLGGTNIKIGLVDDLGRTLSYITVSTAEEKGPEAGVRRMVNGMRQIIEMVEARTDEIVRIGLGAPGPIDISSGMLLTPVNMPHWHHFPISDRLSRMCGLPVTFANDAGAAAFGEFWLGAGQKMHSLVLLTLGTGIGGGIIIDGRSIEGQHGLGAECGHIVIDCNDTARICGCGRRGHLEAYASATAIVKRTIEALESGLKTSLNARLEQGAQLSPLLLAEEAEAGDPMALAIVMDTARFMAIGIVNMMHTIDPNGVFLSGAMNFGGPTSQLGQRFLQRIRDEISRRAFPMLAERTLIDFAQLGSEAGYLGAAGMARAEYQRSSQGE